MIPPLTKITKIILTCKQCGKNFERYPKLLTSGFPAKNRFCSKQCLYKWISENTSGEKSWRWTGWDERQCKLCKRTFKTKQWKKQEFCSPQCQHLWIQAEHKGKGYLLKYKCSIPLEEWKISYLAGLLDGEGNIYEITNRIYIGNTDIKMINWIKHNFGGTIFLGKPRTNHPTWKPCHRWEVHSIIDCKTICQAVLPYTITKRVQIISLLNKCTNYLNTYKGMIKCVS